VNKNTDIWSAIVIAITLVLFGVALVSKGFSEDLVLEAAVFLVSLKLILMARTNTAAVRDVKNELSIIRGLLEEEDKLEGGA
jgi:hypothetical protein